MLDEGIDGIKIWNQGGSDDRQVRVLGTEVQNRLDDNNKPPQDENVLIAIGKPEFREEIVNLLSDTQCYWTFKSTAASINSYASISHGCSIFPGSVIAAKAEIGKHSIVNHNACIDHDVKLGDYVNVNPGSHICGGVITGNFVICGANSVINDGVKIASNVVIGSGSVVVSDIVEAGVYVGIPARRVV